MTSHLFDSSTVVPLFFINVPPIPIKETQHLFECKPTRNMSSNQDKDKTVAYSQSRRAPPRDLFQDETQPGFVQEVCTTSFSNIAGLCIFCVRWDAKFFQVLLNPTACSLLSTTILYLVHVRTVASSVRSLSRRQQASAVMSHDASTLPCACAYISYLMLRGTCVRPLTVCGSCCSTCSHALYFINFKKHQLWG